MNYITFICNLHHILQFTPYSAPYIMCIGTVTYSLFSTIQHINIINVREKVSVPDFLFLLFWNIRYMWSAILICSNTISLHTPHFVWWFTQPLYSIYTIFCAVYYLYMHYNLLFFTILCAWSSFLPFSSPNSFFSRENIVDIRRAHCSFWSLNF